MPKPTYDDANDNPAIAMNNNAANANNGETIRPSTITQPAIDDNTAPLADGAALPSDGRMVEDIMRDMSPKRLTSLLLAARAIDNAAANPPQPQRHRPWRHLP